MPKETAQTIVMIQGRTNSSRLPGKALLDMAGMPIALLCARRVKDEDFTVIFNTSDRSLDDHLAEVVSQAGITVKRGDLDNVLQRFNDGVKEFNDNDIVVRLTADNILPDADFVRELVDAFKEKNTQYLCSGDPDDGVPYGLKAEVFRVGALRHACNEASSDYEKEHVTPYIIEHYGKNSYIHQDITPEPISLRCTIDTWDDYLAMNYLFASIEKPERVSWQSLYQRLCTGVGNSIYDAKVATVTKGDLTFGRLSLGTAQLGSPYGIANQTGKPEPVTVNAMIKTAVDSGITLFDTAANYGDAEERLGAALDVHGHENIIVTSKIAADAIVQDKSTVEDIREATEKTVRESLERLGQPSQSIFLLHNFDDYLTYQDSLWAELKSLQAEGIVSRIGVSVYTPDEMLRALEDESIQFIQFPMNILDKRWISDAMQKSYRARPDVILQARSALLQGVLTLPSEKWPVLPANQAESIITSLEKLVLSFKRRSIVDLAYAYLQSFEWLDSIVVGAEQERQLLKNIQYFTCPALTEVERNSIVANIPDLPESFLNPSCWS